MRILMLLALCTMLVLPLSACNTVDGFGQDLEGAGRSIQKL